VIEHKGEGAEVPNIPTGFQVAHVTQDQFVSTPNSAHRCAFLHGAVHSSTMHLGRPLIMCKTVCGTHVGQGHEEKRGGGRDYLAPDSLRLRLYSGNGIKESHCSIQHTQSTLHLKAVHAFATLTSFHTTIQCKIVETVSTAEQV